VSAADPLLQNGRVPGKIHIDDRVGSLEIKARGPGIGADKERLYVTDEDSQVWSLERRSGSSFWKENPLPDSSN